MAIRKELLICFAALFLGVFAWSQAPKEKPTMPVQLVGNMSFVRVPAFHLEIKDDNDVNAMFVAVEAFERSHPSVRIMSRQLLVTDAGTILGVVLGHEPRTNEVVFGVK